MRKLRGWTQGDLAARAGLVRATVNRAERRGTRSIVVLHRIASALELSISALVESAPVDAAPAGLPTPSPTEGEAVSASTSRRVRRASTGRIQRTLAGEENPRSSVNQAARSAPSLEREVARREAAVERAIAGVKRTAARLDSVRTGRDPTTREHRLDIAHRRAGERLETARARLEAARQALTEAGAPGPRRAG